VDIAKVQLERPIQILFEGVAMPHSLVHLPILAVLTAANDDELTDFIVALSDCHGRMRSAPSLHCFEMAGRACDALLDQRDFLLQQLGEHLPEEKWPARTLFAEWITSFQKIREIAAQTEDECEWYAPVNADDGAILAKQLDGMKRYLDGE
jgi:hypothetical protein